MDGVRDEVVAQRVHLQQRRHPGGVAEVVGVHAPRQRRTRRRLDGADHRVHPPGELLAEEGERQPAEVRAAAGAPDEDVRRLADLGELQERLLADDRLVQQHVVEHAPEGVPGLRLRGSDLDRLGDRDAQRPWVVRGLREDRATGSGELGRRAVHRGAEDLHHQAPVGLLVIARADLPHLALDAEEGARVGQRRAPLAGAGLGRDASDPGLGVVVRLRDRGVRLVRAGGGAALVLVVDPRRRAQGLLEAMGAIERRRPPLAVDVEDRVGDVDVGLRRHLLEDQVHREQRRQVVRSHGLKRARVQRRRRR